MGPLTVDVYVAPMRPFKGAPAQAPGDEPMWSPMSSTLIAGERDAILVDTLVTIDQVDALADWVRGFDKHIVLVYITHGHQDHWIGLARLQEHFPDARGLATPEVVGRATFEATDPGLSNYWKTIFAGELPETPVLPEALDGSEFELEGQAFHQRVADAYWVLARTYPDRFAVVDASAPPDAIEEEIRRLVEERLAARRPS